ncbi:hypothetical protein [Bacillus sp. 179-C3.3 HS]|uniref:hypothetical protein n=1 Tax=Bacillus sp. 179-C3.3 HS TaxID=3232162 RepID=UPI0039A28356
MENAEIELRRIKVMVLLIGIIVLFGACSVSNIETMYEQHDSQSDEENGYAVEGILQSSIQLKNNHFAVVRDNEVLIYRFDEKEDELIPVTKKYIDEWDGEFEE